MFKTIYLPFPVLFIFFQVSSFHLGLCFFHIKLLFNIFYSASLLVMNILRFCSSEKVFISLFFLKVFLLDREF